jgi:hypothetical protein
VCNLLPACNFRHIRREANQVAHDLVQKALRQQECVVMHYNVSSCVRVLIKEEALGGTTPLHSVTPECFG